ncbi:hypothetical protein PoB_001719100 [Plakobranchus ocellatus]|uniref:Uncharacterized protein n=1 Tax=Plakobranchus ocellatus TaxID=259542 RepID=A0AAV3Z7U1_9GAST|nr:hypothetical protein PoB_001719100 [Plakobranchus ocellatus]
MADCDFERRENLAVRFVDAPTRKRREKKYWTCPKIDLYGVVRIKRRQPCNPQQGHHWGQSMVHRIRAHKISDDISNTTCRCSPKLRRHDLVRPLVRALPNSGKKHRVCVEFYVLPLCCSAVIGQNLISAFGLQINGSTIEMRKSSNVSYPTNWALFLKFQLEIFITDDAVPSEKKNKTKKPALFLLRDARKFLTTFRTWMTKRFRKLRTALLEFIILWLFHNPVKTK